MKFAQILSGLLVGVAVVFVCAGIRADEPISSGEAKDIEQSLEDIQQEVGEAHKEVETIHKEVEEKMAGTKKDIKTISDADVTAARDEPKGPLYIGKDLALWTGVIFIVLMFVLWKFAWGPIADGLERREKGIAQQIAEAEAANHDAKQLLEDHRKRLDEAGNEVRQLIEQGRRDAEQRARQIVDEARSEAKAEQQRALAEIDQATAGALSELAAKSAQLAVGLAGKIVKSELKPNDHAELVRNAVKEFSSRN